MPEAHLAARHGEDRPLRVRVRAAQQPEEGHLLHQRQHHEDHRRPLPQDLRRDRARVSRTSRTSTGSSTSARPSWPTRPRTSTCVVLPNLYGDVLSDVAAQIAGSVGLAGSANIGEHIAMFEAIHGSAPRRAGQNLANPSGLFLGAVMMLVHIGQTDVAERAHNAWLRTIEDGIHTYDIYKEGVSKREGRHARVRRGRRRAHGAEAGDAEGRQLQGGRGRRRLASAGGAATRVGRVEKKETGRRGRLPRLVGRARRTTSARRSRSCRATG